MLKLDIWVIFVEFDNGTAPQTHRRQNIGLIHRSHLALAFLSSAESHMRHPFHFGLAVDERIVSFIAIAHLLAWAKVETAREFAHEKNIDPFHQFTPQG